MALIVARVMGWAICELKEVLFCDIINGYHFQARWEDSCGETDEHRATTAERTSLQRSDDSARLQTREHCRVL